MGTNINLWEKNEVGAIYHTYVQTSSTRKKDLNEQQQKRKYKRTKIQTINRGEYL